MSTVSTVNIKDQMFLLLFAKVFDDSEKKLKKVRLNIGLSEKYGFEYGLRLISEHISAYPSLRLEFCS